MKTKELLDDRCLSIFLGLTMLILISGCNTSAPSQVGTQKIPVFPGSKLVEKNSMDATVGDVGGPLDDVTISYWRFTTTASRDDLVAFYKQKFPNATSDGGESDSDSGSTTLWIETSNANISELTIEIGEGEYTIGESVKD